MFSKILRLSLIILFSGGVQAADSSDSFYEDASQLFFEQDYRDAIIQLKNALQLDSEHVPSLLLAGQTYLRLDQPAAAEEYLIKARVLGADRTLVNLRLAQAYLQQAKYRLIIDELSIDGLSQTENVELLGYTAEAWLGLGNEPEAAAAIAQADTIDSSALRPNIARVLLHVRLGELSDAERTGQLLITNHPTSAEAWNSYASALHARGNLQAALDGYSRAVALEPTFIDARIARIALLIDLNEYGKTLGDLDFLNEHYFYEPRAAYFRGLVYSRLARTNLEYSGKASTEFKKSTEVIAQLPPHAVKTDMQLSMIAALAHYSLGEFETSKEYLGHYRTKSPYDLGANLLMGDILLRLQDPLSAIKVLNSAHRAFPADPQVKNLLAEAYSQANYHDKAVQLLSEIEDAGQDTTNTNSRLAFSLLQSGFNNAGTQGLAEIFEQDSSQTRVGYSLVIAQLRNGQAQAALVSAQRLLAQDPANTAYLNLLGVAQRASGNLQLARLTFEKVISLSPELLPPQINLAKIEELQGDTNAARQRLTELKQSHPNNASVVLALAQLENRQGNIDSAIKLAEAALHLDNGNLDIRSLLIKLYLQAGSDDDAETLAVGTVSLFDNNFDSSLILADTYIGLGKPKKAISIYKRLSKEAGFNSETLYKIAQLLIKTSAFPDARHALYKAIEGNPNHIAAQIDYIRVQLKLGDYGDALTRSQRLVENHPQDARGYLLTGDSHMNLTQYAEAETIYRRGLKINFHPALVAGLYKSLMQQDKTLNAGTLLEAQWRQTQQQPTIIGVLYAEHLMRQRDWSAAQAILEELVNTDNSNPTLLNNLAYVLDKQDSPAAEATARQAHSSAPDNPVINDTLGWILVRKGQPEEGLQHLRQAMARLSDNPEIRYHLGKALYQLGRANEAENTLKRALQAGVEFEGRADAIELLKKVTIQ